MGSEAHSQVATRRRTWAPFQLRRFQARVESSARRETIRRRDSAFRRSLALADMLAVSLAVVMGGVVLGHDRLMPGAIGLPIVFVGVVKAMGLYDRDEHLLHKSTLDEVPALFGLSTLGALLIWLADGALIAGELNRGQVLGIWMTLLVGLVVARSLARGLALRAAPPERCLLVGDPRVATELQQRLQVGRTLKAELVGVVPTYRSGNGNPANAELPPELGPILSTQEVDRVILASGRSGSDEILYTIRELKSYGVKVSVIPEASRVAGSSVELDHLHGLTLLGMRRFEFTRSSRLVKRGMDAAGALVALVLLSPLLAMIAAAIKLDTRGPVLFRQRRVGSHGQQFEMLKFRSMVDEAEQLKEELQHLNQGAAGLFKIPDDPRRTRVGRFLRRWQLDELPQLWNVLRGQMSLVGPRPLIPEEDQKIEGWYRRRLDVPPGMTGHWQVLGSSSQIPLNEMVKLDYLYVANWSPWNDVRLMLRTIPFLVMRRGV